MKVILSAVSLLLLAATLEAANKHNRKAQPITDAPWVVIVERNGTQQLLGGIVGPDRVITVTRPILNIDPKNFIVRAGSDQVGRGGSVHSVVKVINNPGASIRGFDVGVITVDPPFQLDETRKIMSVNVSNYDVESPTFVASYDEPGLSVFEQRLTNYDFCNHWYGILGGLTETMGCTIAREGEGPCGADIGSPIIQFGEIIGVLADFPICFTTEWPNLYTNFTYPGVAMWVLANVPEVN